MERYRLKNIIILILVLVNAFLLASLSIRKSAEQDAFRRTAEQLVALFEADGMTLDIYAISRDMPPDALTLARDTTLEQKAAGYLLDGSPTGNDQGGGIYEYRTAAGTALFRSSGSFEASGVLAEEDAEEFCRKFCHTFSFSEPVFQLENGSGTAVAQCLYNHLPVFNCNVTFTIEEGVLTAVDGILLPANGTPTANTQTPLSAAGALAAFQRMRQETVAVVSAVVGTDLCYELQTGSAPMSLVPAWRVATDTADYYVNCQTGVVTAGVAS